MVTPESVRRLATAGDLCAETCRHAWPHLSDHERKREALKALDWSFCRRRDKWIKFVVNRHGRSKLELISPGLSLEGTLAIAVGYLEPPPPSAPKEGP